MNLIIIDWSYPSSTMIVNLDDLKDPHGNSFELPADPEKNLIFDPRPNFYDRRGWTFDIQIIQDSVRDRLIITRTGKKRPCGNLAFRVYDRTKEDVPTRTCTRTAFDYSAPYNYCGLDYEFAPFDTIVAKVHHTVTKMREYAFSECDKMTMCDMSDAFAIEVIENSTFERCSSVQTILFPSHSHGGIKKIGAAAFSHCYAIDVLVLPSTVTSIEDVAFCHCRNLRILKLPDAIDLKYVDDDIIYKCHDLLAKVPAEISPTQWLKDRYDPYPLHKVCYNAYVTVEEIEQCILEHPHAPYLTDEFDMTALHMITIMACTSNIQAVSHNQDHRYQGHSTLGGAGHIAACFHANMSAAFVEDDRGKTPLDYLLEYSELDVHTSLVASLCMHWNTSEGASSDSHQHEFFKRRRYH